MNSVPMNSYEENMLDKELITISIVIPAFNEADRISKTLKKYVSYMLDHYKKFEVVVVDDGSTDGTSNVVQIVSKDLGVPSEEIEFSSTNAEGRYSSTDISVLCLRLSQNVGKGQALRYGVQYSDPRCNFILVADADGSGDIRCLGSMVDGAIENYPQDTIVFGKRKRERESVTFKRSLLSWGFKTVVQILCWPVINGIDDTQCGFKLLPREVALPLYDSLHIRGWAYDVELVFLASLYESKNRCLLLQKPVNWTDEPGSKLVDDSFIGTAKVIEIIFFNLASYL